MQFCLIASLIVRVHGKVRSLSESLRLVPPIAEQSRLEMHMTDYAMNFIGHEVGHLQIVVQEEIFTLHIILEKVQTPRRGFFKFFCMKERLGLYVIEVY